ncbi:hypothetical protein D3C78_1504200 [compost metagenome]
MKRPSPFSASEKMVGNMIELHSPTASRLHIASLPPHSTATAISSTLSSALQASTLLAATWRITTLPRKRPTMAQPQYTASRRPASAWFRPPMSGCSIRLTRKLPMLTSAPT